VKFSMGLLLVGRTDGVVMVFQNGVQVCELEAASQPSQQGANEVRAQTVLVDIVACGTGFVTASAGGTIAVYAAVSRGGCVYPTYLLPGKLGTLRSWKSTPAAATHNCTRREN
jgi:hypothetical protein